MSGKLSTPRFAHFSSRSFQRGVIAVEFALVFTIFFTLLYAIVGFGIILVSKQTLTLAAEEGARAALRYPGIGNSTAVRLANARAAAEAASAWLPAAGRVPATALAESCSYGALVCVRVNVRYNYAARPLLPNLPLFGMIFPSMLDSTAVMQLGPGS